MTLFVLGVITGSIATLAGQLLGALRRYLEDRAWERRVERQQFSAILKDRFER